MILFIIFSLAGMAFGLSYFFGRQRFLPWRLLFCFWLIAIGVAQLRLSPLEQPWTAKFWLILLLFLGLFYILSKIFDKFWRDKIKESPLTNEPSPSPVGRFNGPLLFWALLLATILSVAANIYIYHHFHTLPILSSIPDKMRFAINKEIFGLWEYLALLPRLAIPFTFFYLLINRPKNIWLKILAYLNIVLGFLILSLYASRLTIIFPILMCYFSYLVLNLKKIGLKKISTASLAVVLVVLAISVAIPAFRQHINYRDYYLKEDDDAFSYIMNLSEIKLPDNLRWVAPIYIIPAFNLQAFYRATDYFGPNNFYWGRYNFSTLSPALKIFHLSEAPIKIPWKQIFLPWWITATLLFDYWVDLGYFGIVFAAIFWAALLSGVYYYAVRKENFLAIMLFAYFSFAVVMSIYTNYFLRQELYFDVAIIVIFGLILNSKPFLSLLFKKK